MVSGYEEPAVAAHLFLKAEKVTVRPTLPVFMCTVRVLAYYSLLF